MGNIQISRKRETCCLELGRARKNIQIFFQNENFWKNIPWERAWRGRIFRVFVSKMQTLKKYSWGKLYLLLEHVLKIKIAFSPTGLLADRSLRTQEVHWTRENHYAKGRQQGISYTKSAQKPRIPFSCMPI